MRSSPVRDAILATAAAQQLVSRARLLLRHPRPAGVPGRIRSAACTRSGSRSGGETSMRSGTSTTPSTRPTWRSAATSSSEQALDGRRRPVGFRARARRDQLPPRADPGGRRRVVGCTVDRVGNSSVTLREEIRTLDGELAAEGEAVDRCPRSCVGTLAAPHRGRARGVRALSRLTCSRITPPELVVALEISQASTIRASSPIAPDGVTSNGLISISAISGWAAATRESAAAASQRRARRPARALARR